MSIIWMNSFVNLRASGLVCFYTLIQRRCGGDTRTVPKVCIRVRKYVHLFVMALATSFINKL